MRSKAEAILEFGVDDDHQQNRIVREYRDEYKAISEILDNHPEILELAHRENDGRRNPVNTLVRKYSPPPTAKTGDEIESTAFSTETY